MSKMLEPIDDETACICTRGPSIHTRHGTARHYTCTRCPHAHIHRICGGHHVAVAALGDSHGGERVGDGGASGEQGQTHDGVGHAVACTEVGRHPHLRVQGGAACVQGVQVTSVRVARHGARGCRRQCAGGRGFAGRGAHYNVGESYIIPRCMAWRTAWRMAWRMAWCMTRCMAWCKPQCAVHCTVHCTARAMK